MKNEKTLEEKTEEMKSLYYKVYPDGNGFSWGCSEEWINKTIKRLKKELNAKHTSTN
jgi:hypothetical protein